MKRMFAVVRRPVICLLAMMGSATLASPTEFDRFEIDPTEFVLLEVGNRWEYSHSYSNEMYYIWEDFWRVMGSLTRTQHIGKHISSNLRCLGIRWESPILPDP